MRRCCGFLLFLALASALSSQSYRITTVDVSIEGNTKKDQLEHHVTADTTTVFDSEAALQSYVGMLTQDYLNLRIFEDVRLEYETGDTEPDGITAVVLRVFLDDGISIIVIPGAKLETPVEGTAVTGKVKLENSNFLGTLESLSAELALTWEEDFTRFIPSAGVTFTIPFQTKTFRLLWENDCSLSLTSSSGGSFRPGWGLMTGLAAEKPLAGWTLTARLRQSFVRDLDYEEYGDELYFKEQAGLGAARTLCTLPGIGPVVLAPSVGFDFSWDSDGISSQNLDLLSPELTFRLPLYTKKSPDFQGNYRDGLYAAVTPCFAMNVGRMSRPAVFYDGWERQRVWSGGVTAEVRWYKKYTQRLGIKTRLQGFYFFSTERWYDSAPDRLSMAYQKFDESLRGVRDDHKSTGVYTASSDCALVLNLDLPFTLLELRSERHPIINSELQASVFFDAALGHSRFSDTWFSPRSGFYTAGTELVLYPRRWPSYCLRASLGFDVGRLTGLADEYRSDGKKWEATVGLGLLY